MTNDNILLVLKVLTFIPILAYPAILLASIMSLAGHRSGKESMYLLFVSKAFMIGSLLYPATAYYSIKHNPSGSILIASLPMLHLLLCGILLLLWGRAGRKNIEGT